MKTKFPMSMAAAILIASSGAAQATTLGYWGFGTPAAPTLGSTSAAVTGVTASSFDNTGCAAVYIAYSATLPNDYCMRTGSWNVFNRNWDEAYWEPQYTTVSITPTAGYRYTLDEIRFSIKQADYVDWFLESSRSGVGFGPPSSATLLSGTGGGAAGLPWTAYPVTLTGKASFANLTSGTEFRWYGVANATDTHGYLYFDDISIDGSTQARASLATGKTNAASRVMQNTASVRSTLTLNNNALSAGTTTTEALNWTAALSGATGVSLSSSSGTGLASGSTSTIYANVDTTTTGLKGGTATLTGSNAWRTNGTAGSTSVDYLLADTAVVAQRTVTADTVALGRQMSGYNLSTLGSKTVTLRSTGADESNTRVTVATNLFNSAETYGAAATGSGTIAASGTWASYAVTGEGLTGEGTYSSIAAGYTATLLSHRAVTADTVALGRQMSGYNLSTLGSRTVTLRSTGLDTGYTRVTAATNLFNSAETYATAATGSGTIAASGTFATYAVTGEGLTNEGTYSSIAAGYSATLLSQRSVTADTVALGRQMSGYNLSTLGSKTVTLRSTDADTDHTRVTAATNLFDSAENYAAAATGSGTIAASGTFATYAVTGEGLTNEGTYSSIAAGYSATLLSQRSVTADSISLGRQISGVSLALLTGKTTAFHSNQANSAYTSVSVNGQAFNDTTDRTLGVTGSGTLGASGTFSSYAVTPEGLTNEGTYGNVTVGYTATPLAQRTVTGATLALGRQMSGINLSTLGSATLTLSSTGVDGSYTRTTVATNLFDSTESFSPTTTASGIIAATGTWASYAVTGEGLTGEGSYGNVTVPYTATLLTKRSVTADSISLGRQISGVSLALLTGKTTAFHSNQANSAYTSVNVNGQAFYDTTDRTLSVTGSGTLGANGTFATCAVTGEGLTGEGTYSNVTVGYTATPLAQRAVTGWTLELGRQISGINLSTLGSATLTLSSTGVDGSYTRTTVATNLFDSTESFSPTTTASGIIAATGTWASYAVTGEGLTGEGSYGNVTVPYTATLLSKRAVTADSISLGRQISGVSLALLTGKTTAFHSNQANSAYTSVNVNGQAFTDTTDRTLGVTGSGTLGASGTFASCAVTGEGLTGEGTYSNVTVGYTATPLAKRSVTADTVALGRQMSGYNLSTLGSKNVTLRSTGLDTGNTRLTAATNLFDSTETYTAAATASGTIAASGTWASYPVTAEGLTGEGSYANVNAGYSATLLSKRSVTADSISLGRQISGVSLALLTGKTTAFHSNQANSAYTSVSVNGQAFNDTTDRTLSVTGSGTLGASGTFSSYAVTPEGLTNEGTYGNVTVGYTATPLVKRAVTGATLALGRQMSGINLSELGSQTLTLSSTGVDGSYTRTTVAGNLFNSTETVNKPDVTASGVIAATGTWASYPVTAEGLTGEGSYSNVNVGYIATLLSQRSVTVDSISLGRQISGVSLALLTGKTTAFHSNQANSAYTSVSVNGQAFNDTADHTLGVTGSGALGASGIFASYAVTGEGLTGEGSYGNVAVDYSATPLSQRAVTGDTLVLGGNYLSGARLDNLGSQTLTLRSDGADASKTRVTVAGNVFDTTGSFNTSHTGSGIIGKSGTFASYAVSGEGLTGEGAYDNVRVAYTAAVVGNAGADKSGVKTAFGEALSAPLMAADHLVGLSSWTAAESVVVGTSASLLDGIFGDTPGTVSMAWRARTPDETTAANRLAADVVDLHTGTGTLNPFVLQMSYDPSLLPLTGGMTEEMLAAQGGLFLAWLNGADLWVNAINGNLGTNSGIADYLGSWQQAGSPMLLGSWGVDTSSNSVWAVVDHNSQFSAMSAVPEPANLLALSGLVSSALLLRSRRKRVA